MIPARSGRSTSIPLNVVLHALLSFGAAMLRAGATAFRVRQWMGVMARSMDIDSLSVAFALGSVTASVTRGVEHAMMITEVGPPGVNVWRIGALEDLAKRAKSAMMSDQIMAEIAAIESAPLQYSRALTATAIGAACGAFAFLNNGGPFEVIAAGVGGGVGQWLRAWLARRPFNQYGVTALCALDRLWRLCCNCVVMYTVGLQFVTTHCGLYRLSAFFGARLSLDRGITRSFAI